MGAIEGDFGKGGPDARTGRGGGAGSLHTKDAAPVITAGAGAMGQHSASSPAPPSLGVSSGAGAASSSRMAGKPSTEASARDMGKPTNTEASARDQGKPSTKASARDEGKPSTKASARDEGKPSKKGHYAAAAPVTRRPPALSSPAVRRAAGLVHARTGETGENGFGQRRERHRIRQWDKGNLGAGREQGASQGPNGQNKKKRPPALASPILDGIMGPLDRGAKPPAGEAGVAAAEQLVQRGSVRADNAGAAADKPAADYGDKVSAVAGLSSDCDGSKETEAEAECELGDLWA